MTIASLETLRHEAHPNLLHVLVRAEDGTQGLGETFYEPRQVEACLHGDLAPGVIGADLEEVELGSPPEDRFRSSDWSARSALDLALHDLRGRLAGVPLYELLGGSLRQAVPVYVTCIDPVHPGEDWGLGVPQGSAHRDWTAALERPDRLARELAGQGFGGAKLFPFARLEGETKGRWISDELLAPPLEQFRAMRDATDPSFALMCDLAGGWALEPALRIARALEPFELTWLEDPLPAGRLDDLAKLSDQTSIPLAGHETRVGVDSFRDLFDTGAVSVAHLDVQWCGGLAEAVRIAALADARALPVAFHDCAGPVGWACSLHAAMAIPNAGMLECARPYVLDAYPQMAKGLPRLEAGRALPAPEFGHGVSLRRDYLAETERQISR